MNQLLTKSMTVSDLASASRVNASAVRFYDKHGLIAGERTSGNQRRFSEEDACRIKVIRVAQRVGLSVSEISELLIDLPSKPSSAEWAVVGAKLRAAAQERIDQLNHALDDLTGPVQLCDVSNSVDSPEA
ncbi:MerR family transcriptional regulator [Cryobacterium sp. TMT1-3]|uniref:MerR family transcriptional regulator n=1 Tax=Cryobacterium luteum TaxID=1424661 RepID=A0A1H8M1Y7_9MICO|nr:MULTISPECIES: MerR family transcriptional regulator [Cryobacterium]TFB92248.1 MerR family transcriptional regulator [Cryobacterium luteum]TFC30430.1 MerR family transcriptional regulator [Cryobacterium sp. TMT1-3]SEO11148.1 MerR family transcriptional regulator, redox-sensitive transcriptional activator SoxR [Cryobacterium luteum]